MMQLLFLEIGSLSKLQRRQLVRSLVKDAGNNHVKPLVFIIDIMYSNSSPYYLEYISPPNKCLNYFVQRVSRYENYLCSQPSRSALTLLRATIS